MAARTVGAIIAETAILLDDEQMVRFKPYMLRTWLNEAQREVSKITECLRAKTTIAVTADTQSYAMTANVVRVVEIYFYSATDTQRYPLEYRDHRASRPIWGTSRSLSQGCPVMYWTEGYPGAFTLGLFPIPSQDGTLEVHYNRFSTDFVTNLGTDDASSIDLPTGWEGTCVSWMLMRAFQASRETERANGARAEFDANVGMLIEASVRYVDEPGSITMDSWYDIFGD